MVKWYPTEDYKQSKVKEEQKPTRLRGGIKPGQILILLAGKHQGKRVIFLKQLESGLLLVTGPYKLNGVPLKRIPQAYTIPTTLSIPTNDLDLSSVTDAFFAKPKAKAAKSEEQFFVAKATKKETPEFKKAAQKQIDGKINISDATVKKYLSTKFRLRNGMYPHLLKF
mmetsp:Transcript_17235/g.17159  ORF Transcript_17235/g.17159 Transcript_17235/m.17159 type:complete len:168 (+) Transcript_17235:25-528(+)|eukprot:CAMPEP_0202940530 /NCGR_PEP_ID=MMETSP1395-20130829/671_1 /ASSEMBLY_ACC=CAM_ASM_000871 /TAXON_ID=5961 /ORGANISM="Blepharisma japonicum, Strain Stock R1072" /LENGTH=167 /DNA_ID=CAMNT_0049635063 /DNA_START=3 /DNA_END=506 /DNA_ORIENTATION=+